MLLFRILRSPGDDAGGAAPDEEIVTISRSELDALRGGIDSGRIPNASSKPGPEDLEARFEREIAERERQATEWERAFKSALRDREVATALAGKPLVSGAAAQLI